MRIALEKLKRSLRKLQQHSGADNLGIATQKGQEEQFHFACIPSPRLALLGARKELPALLALPALAAVSSQLPSLSGTAWKTCFGINPNPSRV